MPLLQAGDGCRIGLLSTPATHDMAAQLHRAPTPLSQVVAAASSLLGALSPLRLSSITQRWMGELSKLIRAGAPGRGCRLLLLCCRPVTAVCSCHATSAAACCSGLGSHACCRLFHPSCPLPAVCRLQLPRPPAAV